MFKQIIEITLMNLRNHLKSQRKALAGTQAWSDAIDKVLMMMAPLGASRRIQRWLRRLST